MYLKYFFIIFLSEHVDLVFHCMGTLLCNSWPSFPKFSFPECIIFRWSSVDLCTTSPLLYSLFSESEYTLFRLLFYSNYCLILMSVLINNCSLAVSHILLLFPSLQMRFSPRLYLWSQTFRKKTHFERVHVS